MRHHTALSANPKLLRLFLDTWQLSDSKKGFQLAFVFSANEYFEDEVLTKTYLMDPDDEDECLTKAIGTDIK